jgi:aspartyl-tRNA(Asn)/glutamyl-tRNA(Gln) amidotransferase subunit A
MFPLQTLPTLQDELRSLQNTLPSPVKQYPDTIRSSQDLNAFITVFAEEALAREETVQQKINMGSAGKLAGLVLAVKDYPWVSIQMVCRSEYS